MSEPTNHALVRVEKLTKIYAHDGQEVVVLRDLDLTLEAGEMIGIVGASGAGKSTLLHLIGTLDVPTSGRILYDGVDVTHFSPNALAAFRNRTLGFVFQFHHLLPEFTALENVMMPGRIGGLPRTELEARSRALLDDVGLAHRVTHRPGELSGGEQQRVALARSLVMSPRLVLADEPTGNLDSRTSEQIRDLFVALNEKHGTTFLVVTHSHDLAERMGRVVEMKDGAVVRDERQAPRARTAPERPAPGAPPSPAAE